MRIACFLFAIAMSAASAFGQTAAEKPAATKAKPVVIKDQMSLADARGQISQIINAKTAAEMRKIMKRLSAEDQKQFLAEVNKAISELPASIEEKTAIFMNINHAAIVAAQPGNAVVLLAETFATVPVEALTVLNERFAADMLNRTMFPKVSYSDAEYTKIAIDVMKVVNERTAETDNGSVRSTFAILMLIRSSNGTPADLTDKLIETLPDKDAQELAKTEWIPFALGKDGHEQGYEVLLAAADAGRRPDFPFTLIIAGPQHLESILEDISGKNVDPKSLIATRTPVLDAVMSPIIHQIPNLKTGAASDGEVMSNDDEPKPFPREEEEEPEPEPEPEPRPYGGQ